MYINVSLFPLSSEPVGNNVEPYHFSVNKSNNLLKNLASQMYMQRLGCVEKEEREMGSEK